MKYFDTILKIYYLSGMTDTDISKQGNNSASEQKSGNSDSVSARAAHTAAYLSGFSCAKAS